VEDYLADLLEACTDLWAFQQLAWHKKLQRACLSKGCLLLLSDELPEVEGAACLWLETALLHGHIWLLDPG
jgi:hypothetical protein